MPTERRGARLNYLICEGRCNRRFGHFLDANLERATYTLHGEVLGWWVCSVCGWVRRCATPAAQSGALGRLQVERLLVEVAVEQNYLFVEAAPASPLARVTPPGPTPGEERAHALQQRLDEFYEETSRQAARNRRGPRLRDEDIAKRTETWYGRPKQERPAEGLFSPPGRTRRSGRFVEPSACAECGSRNLARVDETWWCEDCDAANYHVEFREYRENWDNPRVGVVRLGEIEALPVDTPDDWYLHEIAWWHRTAVSNWPHGRIRARISRPWREGRIYHSQWPWAKARMRRRGR